MSKRNEATWDLQHAGVSDATRFKRADSAVLDGKAFSEQRQAHKERARLQKHKSQVLLTDGGSDEPPPPVFSRRAIRRQKTSINLSDGWTEERKPKPSAAAPKNSPPAGVKNKPSVPAVRPTGREAPQIAPFKEAVPRHTVERARNPLVPESARSNISVSSVRSTSSTSGARVLHRPGAPKSRRLRTSQGQSNILKDGADERVVLSGTVSTPPPNSPSMHRQPASARSNRSVRSVRSVDRGHALSPAVSGSGPEQENPAGFFEVHGDIDQQRAVPPPDSAVERAPNSASSASSAEGDGSASLQSALQRKLDLQDQARGSSKARRLKLLQGANIYNPEEGAEQKRLGKKQVGGVFQRGTLDYQDHYWDAHGGEGERFKHKDEWEREFGVQSRTGKLYSASADSPVDLQKCAFGLTGEEMRRIRDGTHDMLSKNHRSRGAGVRNALERSDWALGGDDPVDVLDKIRFSQEARPGIAPPDARRVALYQSSVRAGEVKVDPLIGPRILDDTPSWTGPDRSDATYVPPVLRSQIGAEHFGAPDSPDSPQLPKERPHRQVIPEPKPPLKSRDSNGLTYEKTYASFSFCSGGTFEDGRESSKIGEAIQASSPVKSASNEQ